MMVTDKRDSVSLAGVRFEVVEPVSKRATGEVIEGGEVVERGWFDRATDMQLWRLVVRGVLDFAEGELFTVLGMDGDVVCLRGWEGFVIVKVTGETFRVGGGVISGRLELHDCALVGVGMPSWRRVRDYDLGVVRCLNGKA